MIDQKPSAGIEHNLFQVFLTQVEIWVSHLATRQWEALERRVRTLEFFAGAAAMTVERMEFRVFIDELAAWVVEIASDQWMGLERR